MACSAVAVVSRYLRFGKIFSCKFLFNPSVYFTERNQTLRIFCFYSLLTPVQDKDQRKHSDGGGGAGSRQPWPPEVSLGCGVPGPREAALRHHQGEAAGLPAPACPAHARLPQPQPCCQEALEVRGRQGSSGRWFR